MSIRKFAALLENVSFVKDGASIRVVLACGTWITIRDRAVRFIVNYPRLNQTYVVVIDRKTGDFHAVVSAPPGEQLSGWWDDTVALGKAAVA